MSKTKIKAGTGLYIHYSEHYLHSSAILINTRVGELMLLFL